MPRLGNQRIDEQLQPQCQREGLMGVLTAERHELVIGSRTGENVAERDAAHRHIGHERSSVSARNRDCERVRAGELRAAVRMSESRGRRRGERGDQSAVGQPANPVSEHPRRKAAVGDDDTRVVGRRGELCVADRRQREIAERTAPVPPLEARLVGDELGTSRGIEIFEGGEPLDPREAVATLPASLGGEEVVGECLRVAFVEAEARQTRGDVNARG